MVKATILLWIFQILKTVFMLLLQCQILKLLRTKPDYQIGYQSFKVIKVKLNLILLLLLHIHATFILHGFMRRMMYGDIHAPSGTWINMSLLKCLY